MRALAAEAGLAFRAYALPDAPDTGAAIPGAPPGRRTPTT